MAELKVAHIVVEIPVDGEHQQKQICAIQNHPLSEISHSPGHLLLLKLWQREEDLFGRRISIKENRMNSIRSELFEICLFFVLFHGLILTLLFTSSVSQGEEEHHSCKKWWMPSVISAVGSAGFVVLAQMKAMMYWSVWGELQRERNESRAVSRCIQELRMKGSSFDLSKEPLQSGCGRKRMKSSSVEIKWKPVTWFSHYLITICLFCFSGLAFPASRFILCAF